MSLLARLPQAVNYRLGVVIGALFFHFAKRRRHICDTNLKLCFPENSPEAHARLLRRTMRDQGIGLMETLRVWFRPVDKLGIELELHNGELLDIAEGDPGILVIGCHFTCLDVVGLLIGKRYGVDSFYRRHKNPVLEWILSRSRGRFGEPIHRRDMKRALRRLREGKRLFYLPDQDYGRKSAEFVDFFGVKAATTIGTGTLAKGGRARAVIGVMRREQRGRRYVCHMTELEHFPEMRRTMLAGLMP